MSCASQTAVSYNDAAGQGRERSMGASRLETFLFRSTLRVSTLLALALLLSGCAKELLMCPRVVKVPAPELPEVHPAPVLFGTDRLPESREKLTFSSALNPSGDHMSYGVKCEDPARAKAACDVESLALDRSQFLDRIANAKGDIVLYVHGFNYTFDESLEVALSIVERARFPATPVAYSWPSQGRVGGYGVDYDMSEWTVDHLAAFIRDITPAVPAGHQLHFVSHSMGNRALLLALSRLDLADPRFGQLILIAPDVDAQIFAELMAHSGPFRRKTMYVSQNDWALHAVSILHSGAIRAGDARKQYTVLSGVDTVDLSPLKAGVTGHSIYDYSQLVFEDLGAVLKDEAITGRHLTACTVKSVAAANRVNGTSLPCVVFRMPSK
ncbi:MAG TPA: alpha/beta hydrolase [Candidatus Angelobacter sp.]|nr:alpha/beta hydrolase [Candidatus Angelobacter sp.]